MVLGSEEESRHRIRLLLKNTSPQELARTGSTKSDWDVKEPVKQSKSKSLWSLQQNARITLIDHQWLKIDWKGAPLLVDILLGKINKWKEETTCQQPLWQRPPHQRRRRWCSCRCTAPSCCSPCSPKCWYFVFLQGIFSYFYICIAHLSICIMYFFRVSSLVFIFVLVFCICISSRCLRRCSCLHICILYF